MTAPTVRSLAAKLGTGPGVIVRPFADRRGAVVITPRAVAFVETIAASLLRESVR